MFVAVAAVIGLPWAAVLLLAGSLSGALVLRHAGSGTIARIRMTTTAQGSTAWDIGHTGSLAPLAGFLLLIPGFITDILALLLLLAPLRGMLGAAFCRGGQRQDAVVDLAPDQWRRVPNAELPRRDREP
ncbi:MAG: FxsA family protein [Pseudolabrys sp.]|nr:FxsA family protein [Pseudolabrys sp.]